MKVHGHIKGREWTVMEGRSVFIRKDATMPDKCIHGKRTRLNPMDPMYKTHPKGFCPTCEFERKSGA